MYYIYKADTGAIRFQVRYPMRHGFAVFTLTSKSEPKLDLYQVFFGVNCRLVDVTKHSGEHVVNGRLFNLAEIINSEFRSFWLTWHSSVICLGIEDQPEPILTYADDRIIHNNIGFIKFYIDPYRMPVEWVYEASPVILKPLKEKKFGGKLRWVTVATATLPDDAMIGGFENEPLYIARAPFNNSLSVGKFVCSKASAFVPWGGGEHQKFICQVLCGYDAKWVKTKGNFIPENAFVAGLSEVRGEPLYVGRAMYDNHLLVGKVHTLYSTCYLPYNNTEIEMFEYEILVRADRESRAVHAPSDEHKRIRLPAVDNIFNM